jgi:hypothetical protein
MMLGHPLENEIELGLRPEEYRPGPMSRPRSMADYAEAKRALEKLQRELMDLNRSATCSLDEGRKKRSPFTSYASLISFAELCVAPT